MTRKLPTIVAEIAEEWLTRMLELVDEEQRGLHRAPCQRCTGSPLREALGTFGGLPHHLVHPLISRLESVIHEDVVQQLGEQLDMLRFVWRERLDLDEDGDPPSSEWFELVAADHEDAWRDELQGAEARRAELRDEVAVHLAAFTDARAVIGAVASERVIARALEWIGDAVPDSALLDGSERAVLDEGITSILERWFIWLPAGAWRRTPPIPNGSRCTSCDSSPFFFSGFHGASHRVVTGIDELVRDHVEAYGVPRIEPPGLGRLAEYRAEVQRHARETLDAHAYPIHRALQLHVLLPVEAEIRRATAHLFVLPETEGGAEPGASR